MRGDKTFAYDLIVRYGPVSCRVALLLRSAEGKPPSTSFQHPHPSPPARSVKRVLCVFFCRGEMQGKPPVLRVGPRGRNGASPKQWAVVVWPRWSTLQPCCGYPVDPILANVYKKCRKSTPPVATLQLYRGDPQDRCQVLGTPAPLSPAAGFIFDDVLTLWSCRGYPAEVPLCAPGFAGGGSGFDIPLRG